MNTNCNFALVIQYLISGLALLASGISIYFQFFHKPRRLRVISMPSNKDGHICFGLCNGGKVNVFITGLSVDFYWPIQGEMHQFTSVGEVRCSQKILIPGDIAEHSFELKPPPQPVFGLIQSKKNDNGEEERTLEIIASIQFAFPSGKTYRNTFKLGSYSIIDDGKGRGFKIYGLNLDLIKGALPIDQLWEKAQPMNFRKRARRSRST